MKSVNLFNQQNEPSPVSRWIYVILLVLILIGGGYLRLVGLDWDENQHLHPDERFLTMVTSAIHSVENVGEYFDTANSSLNPHNRGYGFYVYGTLPIFIVRYVGEGLGKVGYGDVYLVGRVLSAMMDLMTVTLVYFIGTRLYNRRVGLLGAAFLAMAVLPIQLSHFYAVDTFTTFFMTLAVYFAVEIATTQDLLDPRLPKSRRLRKSGVAAQPGTLKLSSFLLFGLALGMAVASKISAAPVAVVLPLAAWIYWSKLPSEKRVQKAARIFGYLLLAALVSILAFRIFQPYAFSGPGFFGLRPNELWLDNMKSIRAQMAGDVDFPPALQWARRPLWFSVQNLVLWGLGLPLGILAWAGFLGMAWRMFKEKTWKRHLLVWGWVALYFGWQSIQWNPMLRYQLPIYPLLSLFAAWAVFAVKRPRTPVPPLLVGEGPGERSLRERWVRAVRTIVAVAVFTATFAYAYAFTRIYTRPHTRVEATRWIFQHVPGPVTLSIETEDGLSAQLLPYPQGTTISAKVPWNTAFTARSSGELTTLTLPHIQDESGLGDSQTLRIELFAPGNAQPLGVFEAEIAFHDGETNLVLDLAHTPSLTEGEPYQLVLSLVGEGEISLLGAAVANESAWDDGQPLRMDGYDPFGGIYQGDLNFELYWDDNAEKLERFTSTLDRADYIFITSSRQWASTTRVPERYPLTSEYYRHLLGCPPGQELEGCYNVAQPGTSQGDFGFELIKVFQSNPSLGILEINDQPSEESFTVYDHPKVFIFQKTQDYDASHVQQVLGAVDLSAVVHLTPKQAGRSRADNPPQDLTLPPSRLEEQRQGGTWSTIFNPDAAHNRYQILGVILWYLSVTVLGLAAYPLLRYLFPALDDRGYPLARTVGLLLLSYLVWIAGSARIPFTRGTIALGLVLLGAMGGGFAYQQREALRKEWRSNRRYFLMVEGLALAVFAIALLIRFGNPDLWHPWKGGEKPMDFSYFNAVLKSTSFPPYDPWYAGGYINYYYYGFVFVGVLVKFLGIVPAFAYNLILPTLLMLIALGAFSIVWNLSEKRRFQAGLAGLLGMAVLGNLGTLRMVFRGFQRLASAGVDVGSASLFHKIKWTFQGIWQAFLGAGFSIRPDEWYWNPSRVIGSEHGGAITEFPFFTFLYGDLHAHFIVLPLTLLALTWMLSLALTPALSHRERESASPLLVGEGPGVRSSWLQTLLGLLLGSLVVGALRPTNTWDFYPYLALGSVALGYFFWSLRSESNLKDKLKHLGIMGGLIALFVILAHLFYLPYAEWYGQGYTKIRFWHGTHTPLGDYLTHWGVFLFVVISWMFYETVDWMARTPLSALRKLKPYRDLILGLALLFLVVLIALGVPLSPAKAEGDFSLIGLGVPVVWVALPLMVWAGILLLRPNFSPPKLIVLFLTGTALAMTLMVEIIVLQGDIGRMNTVFKFYLQAWTLLAISAAASFGWLFSSLERWPRRASAVWQVGLACLVGGAALYPFLGGIMKIEDRMTTDAPHTLDGMKYMQYAEYGDSGITMDLSQDHRAIRWLQENVEGSPVIVEANQVEYHWATRYTIYTGLPGVVGWNWHQRQQRGADPNANVQARVDAVNDFYTTTDTSAAHNFLEQYDVQYIILGQLERAHYAGPGLEKFPAAEGVLWESVYQDQDTVIYQVLGD